MSFSESMRSDSAQQAEQSIDYWPLLGTWVNLNPDTYYLSEVTLRHERGTYWVGAQSSLNGEIWTAVEANVLAANGSNNPLGFNASFHHATSHTSLAAIINQGICVIQTYTCYTDGSGRANYFSKEYFRTSQDHNEARSA